MKEKLTGKPKEKLKEKLKGNETVKAKEKLKETLRGKENWILKVK